jgi:hypothetical protein
VAPLQVDGELTAAAQSWAQHMAATNTLAHAPDITSGISQNWLKVGENVGVGPDVGTIMAAFVGSAKHYANIVDPAFNRIGVGVAQGGGHEYTCHRFMQVAGSSPPPPTTPRTTPSATGGGSKKGSSSGSSSSSGSGGSADPTPPADPTPAVSIPPAPQPGPPPPADAARVAAVLAALRHLSA